MSGQTLRLDPISSPVRGYDALTMRRVAGVVDTGPASLYAHVGNKADFDELLIGRLCAQIRDQYLPS